MHLSASHIYFRWLSVEIECKEKAAERQRRKMAGQLEGGKSTMAYLELIDGLLWLYHSVASKQVLKVRYLNTYEGTVTRWGRPPL